MLRPIPLISEISLKPAFHFVPYSLDSHSHAWCLHILFPFPASRAVQHQPDTGRKNRVMHHAFQTANVLRNAESDRHVEYLLRQVNRAFHLAAAAGKDKTAPDKVFETAASQARLNQ